MQDTNNIEILVRLFETLKDSSIRNENVSQRLLMQQIEMVNQIKNLPVEDLKVALKEHMADSAKDINTCAGTIEIHTNDIKELIKVLTNKVSKMITVVAVTFSLLAGTYTVMRVVSDEQSHIDQLKQELVEERDARMDEMLNEIRKEMRNYHQSQPGGK
jgi:DNA-binding transcriptional MerR regulator